MTKEKERKIRNHIVWHILKLLHQLQVGQLRHICVCICREVKCSNGSWPQDLLVHLFRKTLEQILRVLSYSNIQCIQEKKCNDKLTFVPVVLQSGHKNSSSCDKVSLQMQPLCPGIWT
jgi:hypothetical protein